MPREDEKTLAATLLATMGVQTIGAVDLDHKLPSPRVYALTWLIWWILGLVAAMSRAAARLAATFSILILVTILMGKAGLVLIDWLRGVGPSLEGPPKSTASWIGTLRGLVKGIAGAVGAGGGDQSAGDIDAAEAQYPGVKAWVAANAQGLSNPAAGDPIKATFPNAFPPGAGSQYFAAMAQEGNAVKFRDPPGGGNTLQWGGGGTTKPA